MREEAKPSIARYERVQLILESDPTLRSAIGPRKQKVLKRDGTFALFSRGAVLVTEELQKRGEDPNTASRAYVQGLGAQLLGLVSPEEPSKVKAPPEPKPSMPEPEPEPKPKPEPKPEPEPESKRKPLAAGPASAPQPDSPPKSEPTPKAKRGRPKRIQPAKPSVASTAETTGPAPAAVMPIFCPFVSIASLLHSTYNLMKLTDRQPGAERRLERVTELLEETVALKDVAIAVPVESLPASIQHGQPKLQS